MKRLKRTSYYDKNRSSYLDEENQEYVYEFISYDEKGRPIPVRQAIAITKNNIELIKELDQFDHQEDLQNLYQSRVEDKSMHKSASDDEFNYSKLANIPDKKQDIFKMLFEDTVEEDTTHYDSFMALLTEEQRNLIYQHVNLGKSIPQISRESGGRLTIKALENKWEKIKRRVKKYYRL